MRVGDRRSELREAIRGLRGFTLGLALGGALLVLTRTGARAQRGPKLEGRPAVQAP
jgi:hypothetical protein